MRLPGEDDESLDRPEPEHREQAEPADVAPIVAITEGDLDFDALVSDFAPVDLLEKRERAGRVADELNGGVRRNRLGVRHEAEHRRE